MYGCQDYIVFHWLTYRALVSLGYQLYIAVGLCFASIGLMGASNWLSCSVSTVISQFNLIRDVPVCWASVFSFGLWPSMR